MKLEKYISDLLYRYDLVIVPDFGAMIGRRKNARLNRSTNLFSPPYKELSFNINLQEDDGLLARYVADIQLISNEDALHQIQQIVAMWKHTLDTSGNLKLDQIGVFKKLGENRILYMPLNTKNYLSEAYGLTTFMHKPIVSKQDKITVVSNVKVKTNHTNLPFEHKTIMSSKTNNSIINKQIVKYAAIFVIGLGLFGGVAKMYQNIAQQPVEKFQKATFVLTQDFPAIKINDVSKPDKPMKPIKKQLYFIISGAFRSEDNAQKKVDLLIKERYHAKIVGKNKNNLYLVAYQGYANMNDAEKALKDIQKTQPSAWIFNIKQ